MCGIFAYLNYLTPKSRKEILELLVGGLKRLEYRGYDSAGVALDTAGGKDISIIKKTGKVKALEEEIFHRTDVDFESKTDSHVGIAHTRWATHGVPSEVNSHPQRSDFEHSFVVVHNGIVTNYKEVKTLLEQRGYVFESETDTEVIAKLIHHLWIIHPGYSFRELVEQVVQQIEGAFALCFKSKHFPGECVATRRGSPLLVGIKTKTRLATDHVPILYGKDFSSSSEFLIWILYECFFCMNIFFRFCSTTFHPKQMTHNSRAKKVTRRLKGNISYYWPTMENARTTMYLIGPLVTMISQLRTRLVP